MTPTTFPVTGCDDCPFRRDYSNSDDEPAPECTHPNTPVVLIEKPKRKHYPPWCPLLTAPITITLETRSA